MTLIVGELMCFGSMAEVKTHSRLSLPPSLSPPAKLAEFDLVINGRKYPRPPPLRGPRHLTPWRFLVDLCLAHQQLTSTISSIHPIHMDNSKACSKWSIRIKYGGSTEELKRQISLISSPGDIVVVPAPAPLVYGVIGPVLHSD